MHDGELWQEYDTTGEPIGLGRPAKEFDGDIICGATLVWLYRDTATGRELLFQKRSKKVDRFPGKWDVSAGGHINGGETRGAAAVRECKEEIGVDIAPQNLQFVVSTYRPISRKLLVTYLYEWKDPDTFRFDDGEVETVQWIPLESTRDFVEKNVKKPLSDLSWYWEVLLSSLEQA